MLNSFPGITKMAEWERNPELRLYVAASCQALCWLYTNSSGPAISLKCRFRFSKSRRVSRFCISNKLPGDADVVGPRTML